MQFFSGAEKKRRVLSDEGIRDAVKLLRKYYHGYTPVDGYDLRRTPLREHLSPTQIRRIYRHLAFLRKVAKGDPVRVYRPRTKAAVRSVLKAQGYTDIPVDLRVAFVPDFGVEKTDIHHRARRRVVGKDRETGKTVDLVTLAPVATKINGVTIRFIGINPNFMTDDAVTAVQEAMKLYPADSYQFKAGMHIMHSGDYVIKPDDGIKEIGEKLAKLTLKYDGKDGRSDAKEWLMGLVAYRYPTQKTYAEYLRDASRVREEVKHKRKLYYKRLGRIDRKIEKLRRSIQTANEQMVKEARKKFVTKDKRRREYLEKRRRALMRTIRRDIARYTKALVKAVQKRADDRAKAIREGVIKGLV